MKRIMTLSTPFRINEVFAGFAETHGIIRIVDEELNVEFQTKDSLAGIIKSDVKCVTIDFDKIEQVEFKKRFFGNRLLFRFSSLMVAEELPCKDPGCFEVVIDRKDVGAAESVAAKVNLAVTEKKIRDISID